MRTYIFVVLVVAIFAVQPINAELITLQNHIVDTGDYFVLLRYSLITEPILTVDDNITINQESIKWDNGIVAPIKRTGFAIFDIQSVDNPGIIKALLKKYSSQNATKVSKPYPGWIFTSNNTRINYIGQINSSELIVFATNETPEMATYILQNLKVYPIADKDELTRQKVAEGLQ